MSYTWLFFDADDTLFDFGATERKALQATLGDQGFQYQPEYLTIFQTINRRMWHLFEAGQISSERLRVQRFEEFTNEARLKADAGRISSCFLENLAKGTDLLDGAEEIISLLAPRYHLGLITNGLSSVQRPRLAASRLANVFQMVLISEEIGLAKPDPRYFQAAMKLAGDPSPADILVIGDSLSSDIRGANLAGLDACWFNPRGLPLPDIYMARYQINALNQLLNFL